jgi:hypothetical protein
MKEMNKSVVNNIYSLLSLLNEFDNLPPLMAVPHDWDEAKPALVQGGKETYAGQPFFSVLNVSLNSRTNA